MNQGYKNDDLPAPYTTDDIKTMYDQYADKLLGYILPMVDNRELAEDCVVKVFANVASLGKNFNTNAQGGSWSRLMALASTEIETLGAAANECKSVVDNATYIQSHKYLNKMNDVQRRVFCGVYYHRKTTGMLAVELNMSESELRLMLKEAFMIIRKVKDED